MSFIKTVTPEQEKIRDHMREVGLFRDTPDPETTITLTELTKVYRALLPKKLYSEEAVDIIGRKIAECFGSRSE